MKKPNLHSSAYELVVRTTYGADWRWRRANQLVDGQRPICPDREDPFVASICQVLRADADPMPKTPDSDWAAAFQAALDVYRLPSSRLEIEALILSGMPVSEISGYLGVERPIVTEFQRCFFDVDWCRDAPDRIVSLIEPSSEPDDRKRTTVLKQAYFGGPLIAKHWVENLPSIGVDALHDLNTATGRQRERLELALLQEAIDPLRISPQIAAELGRQVQATRRLPTIGQLLEDQIDGTIADLPAAEDRTPASSSRPSSMTTREQLQQTA